MNRLPIVLDDTAKKTVRADRYNRRLRLVIGALALMGVVAVTIYFNAIDRRENSSIDRRMETFTELRQSTLSRYLNSRSQETILWASHKSVVDEAKRYFDIWDGLSVQDRQALRTYYINGGAAGEQSGGNAAYSAHHNAGHDTRQAFMRHHKYYDVFYFNMAGDLVYSVVKEADYGLNFAQGGGAYADSALGQAFRAARDSEAGTTVFFDFAPYAPTNGAPAAFLASPIVDARGNSIGVYAIQLSIEQFNSVMQYSSGLGDSGETYVVGQDLLMRNNSRLVAEPTMLVRTIDTAPVQTALDGRSVLTRNGRNASREKVLVAASPLEFNGTRWAVVTEMELAELKQPLKPYRWFYAISVLFVLAFAALQYGLLRLKAA